MARVNTYLNFPGNTEEAFNFYKSVFGGEFTGGIQRFKDIPPSENNRPVPEDAKNLVMHIALPIFDGHVLMGTDAPKTMGFNVNFGNNVYISLQPDSREDTTRLFKALANGGKVEMDLQDTFWGDYYGSLTDKFGIHWMLDCEPKK